MTITTYLKDCFAPPKQLVELTSTEIKAIQNLITVSRERLWLNSNYPKRPEPSFDFSEDISLEEQNNIEKSIDLALQVVHNHRPTAD